MADADRSSRGPGPYAVERAQIDHWSDAADGSVAVRAQYPRGRRLTEPLPVVVFAHGLGGSERGYATLGHRLASHGYAVLHPQFLDAFSACRDRLGMTDADEHSWPRDPVLRAAMHEMLFSPAHWISRVGRVHAVLDSLASQSHLPVALRPDGVVIGGHSFGAYTAQLVLGAELTGVPIDTTWFRHRAVAAGLLLSPQGSGDRGLTARSWDAIVTPLLVVTATGDLGPHGEGPPWRRQPYDAAASPWKHLAVVRKGDHLLGGIDGTEEDVPTDSGTVRAVADVCAAFVDRVHGDASAAGWLAAGPYPALLRHELKEIRDE